MEISGQSHNGLVRAQAIAGSHVVTLGMNMSEQTPVGYWVLAFISTDKTENEAYWLEGQKRFQITDPGLPAGAKVPTNKHPIQSFLWGDFTAKPSHQYTYRVVAIRGTPEAPVEAEAIDLSVDTEDEGRDLHDIHFNRGAISSRRTLARLVAEATRGCAEAYDWPCGPERP
jgi:hypothetical protein